MSNYSDHHGGDSGNLVSSGVLNNGTDVSNKLIALVVNWSGTGDGVWNGSWLGNVGWVRAINVILVHDDGVGWGLSFVWNHNVSGKVVLVVNLWDGVESVNWGKSTDVGWVGVGWGGNWGGGFGDGSFGGWVNFDVKDLHNGFLINYL